MAKTRTIDFPGSKPAARRPAAPSAVKLNTPRATTSTVPGETQPGQSPWPLRRLPREISAKRDHVDDVSDPDSPLYDPDDPAYDQGRDPGAD
jgi:hypothetical protein